MAIRLTSGVGGSIYERSTNLPAGNYTQMAWVQLVTGGPGLSCIFCRTNNAGSPTAYEVLGFNTGAGGPLTIFSSNSPLEQLVRSVNVGEWFFVALRVASGTYNVHTRYATESTFTSVTGGTDTFAPARFSVGTDYFGDPVPDIRIEGWQVFDTDIGATECLAYSYASSPVRFTNLNSFVPFWTTQHVGDYSGNARTIAASGTAPVNVNGPPVPRQVRRGKGYSTASGPPPTRQLIRTAPGTILRGSGALIAA